MLSLQPKKSILRRSSKAKALDSNQQIDVAYDEYS
jgi:hypothetical protein